ncbi:MAG: glutathione peroxidase [Bacteroidaceae bacterium]|nr:glutathione peroxidase [Bacteroidaceae bacterium]
METRIVNVYDFSLPDKQGNEVSLALYKGKVLLIVNTASRCGFTPQYEELEAMYERLKDKGLEILDIPCNQFGQQAPGSDEEISQFCQLNYGTKFPQFKKSLVNGEGELPLYTWLKAEQGFKGFNLEHPIGKILQEMLSKADPQFAEKSDIKWNFTKFLINREGKAIRRFEPTEDMKDIERAIAAIL